MKDRFSLKISGASGQGINSVGEIFAQALKNAGYKIFAYREYPSLIRGGFASYQIDVSDEEINSSTSTCDLLVCLDKESFHQYLSTVSKGGAVIHALLNLEIGKNEEEFVRINNIKIEFVNALEMANEIGGSTLFANVVLSGFVWKVLGEKLEIIREEVGERFAKKKDLLEFNYKALEAGYKLDSKIKDKEIMLKKDESWRKSMIITGNYSLALGAIAAGMRAMYSYPMTPATSILSYVAKTYQKTGILVKQAEDEITAAQLAIGSMYAGTRALVATSGGGFDLMTESLSLAGITETPFVAVIAQRPGPATGLPTWTSAGDLNLAVYSGHSEFPRCVIGASGAVSAYELMQKAFDIAEKYQIPVIVLTEKQIAESLYNIKDLGKDIPVKRYLVEEERLEDLEPSDRYKVTENGVSPRWLPGQSKATFDANSDEHAPDGSSTEDAEVAKQQMEKRMKKEKALLKELPEPLYFGSEDEAETVFIGWGSVRGAVLDAIRELGDKGKKYGYLHYEYLYPLKIKKINELIKNNRKLVLVENNYLGQLGGLISKGLDIKFDQKLLKYDGRPIFVDDILAIMNK